MIFRIYATAETTATGPQDTTYQNATYQENVLIGYWSASGGAVIHNNPPENLVYVSQGTPVQITYAASGGNVTISFADPEKVYANQNAYARLEVKQPAKFR
jgi:hypothetical protein